MLEALAEGGIEPDLIVGTSAGAINGAWVAGHSGLAGPHTGSGYADGLADIWTGLKRDTVFPTNLIVGLRGFLGRTDHLVPPAGLRHIVTPNLTFDRLEDAPTPLYVVATNALTGVEKVFDRGNALDVVVASASVPGVLPPVRIDGFDYIDGGVSNNTPISVAASLGAEEIWVLPCGHPCSLAQRPRSALAMVLHAVTLLVHQRLVADIAKYEPALDLRVVPPLCPLNVGPTDFSQAARLIASSHATTTAWLAAGVFDGTASALLEPHAH